MIKEYEFIDTLRNSKANYIKSNVLYEKLFGDDEYQKYSQPYHELIRVFIVCLPAEYGGRPLVVCWSRRKAEKIVEAMARAEETLSSEEYQKHFGMPPGLKPIIWVTTIDPLASIPAEEEKWELQMEN